MIASRNKIMSEGSLAALLIYRQCGRDGLTSSTPIMQIRDSGFQKDETVSPYSKTQLSRQLRGERKHLGTMIRMVVRHGFVVIEACQV